MEEVNRTSTTAPADRVFRDLVDAAGDYIFSSAGDGRIIMMNPAARRALGYDEDAISRLRVADIVAPEHMGRLSPPAASPEGSSAAPMDLALVGHDGNRIQTEASLRSVGDGASPGGVNVIAREVTDRRTVVRPSAADLHESSRERFSRVFQAAPVPMAIVRCADRRFLDANSAFATLLGRPHHEIVRATDDDLQLWSECDDSEILDKYPQRRIRNRICSIRGGGSQVVRTVCSTEPIVLDSDPCALLIVEDLSELLQLEDQLRQAQKMESVGLLAGGVAHEFNNILTVIQGNISLVQISGTRPEDASEAYDEVLKATDRAATLTSQLLAFSRKGILQPRQVDLSAVVRGCENILEKLLGENLTLEVSCDEGLAPINADEHSLVQILMSLVANARDATARGGRISIQSTQVELDATAADSAPEARSGHFAVLSVSDSGSGMEPAVLRRIFDPFYTTKEPGYGTGLGLSMVQGIVKQQHGWIDVQSESGSGTRFTIYLPTIESPRPVPSAPEINLEDGHLPRGEGEVVLVVEDEPQLRELACMVLRKHGYEVFSCETGREALDTWGTNQDHLDLLFTDVAMPGGVMGDELARALLAGRPDLGVICASGYSSESLPQDLYETLEAHFLQKPYSFEELLQLIRFCLAGESLSEPASP